MKDKLIKLGFNEWLTSLQVAPYPVMFWDIPEFIQLSYIQKWFREIHKISVLPEHGRMEDNSFGYFCRIYTKLPSSGQTKVFEYRNSYEQALEIGLQEALKLI